MKKTLIIKAGVVILATFSLVGCSNSNSNFVHKDLLTLGQEFVKIEYDNVSVGNFDNTDKLDTVAEDFKYTWYDHQNMDDTKIDKSFVNDVVDSRGLYMKLQHARELKFVTLGDELKRAGFPLKDESSLGDKGHEDFLKGIKQSMKDDNKEIQNLKQKAEKDWKNHISKMKTVYGIDV